MAHHNTVFAQMLKFIPTCLSRQGHEFESLANQHHSGRRLHKMTRWTQFVAMATVQLSGRPCLQQAGQPSECGQQPHGSSAKALPLGHECCEPVFLVQGQRVSPLKNTMQMMSEQQICIRRDNLGSSKLSPSRTSLSRLLQTRLYPLGGSFQTPLYHLGSLFPTPLYHLHPCRRASMQARTRKL